MAILTGFDKKIVTSTAATILVTIFLYSENFNWLYS